MARPSVKPQLIEAALDQFHGRGFHACSVDDITRAAGVPKGSFYNHFPSKDALAVEALRHYQTRSVWRRNEDADLPPLRRLRRRFEVMGEAMRTHGYARGCFIGNMASELADLNAPVRAEVQNSLDFRSTAATELLLEAQRNGELATHLDPHILGPFLVNSWEGVVTRTKVCKSAAAMDGFFAVFDQLLGEASS